MRQVLSLFIGLFLTHIAVAGSNSSHGHAVDTKTWNTVGEPIWYTSATGVLAANPAEGKSYLVSPKAYKNFKLELEFFPDDKVNSGVFINCDTNKEIGSKFCYEANISDNHKTPEFRTGSIVRHAPPGSKVDSIGKWNTMAFTSKDGKVTVEINGVKTAESSSEAHPGGYIGLQRFKDGVIMFRNVKITEL